MRCEPLCEEGARPTTIELCAGGGGQAIGIEAAGFVHLALVERNTEACKTLSRNRPSWPVWNGDLKRFDATAFRFSNVTLVAGGIPCQPFTMAGRQKGRNDERDLFPDAIRVVRECLPQAFMFENVAALTAPKFARYLTNVLCALRTLGYHVEYGVINAVDFGVPQERRRLIIVGRRSGPASFPWPRMAFKPVTVGETLGDLMAASQWPGASQWKLQASRPAPTIVGGSDRHGGPDLGPTRARLAWASMRVDGRGVADVPPAFDFPEQGIPRLTLRMTARLQGFQDSWEFAGSKTAAYRQIGNAFPPPVAKALASAILEWLKLPETQETRVMRQLDLLHSCG